MPFSIPVNFKFSVATDETIKNEQKKSLDQDTPADIPLAYLDEAPIFPGCENATNKKDCFVEQLNEHVKKYFYYPNEAQEYGLQGRVAVLFTIDEEGNVTNIRKRGPHKLLEDAAEEIILKLPKMKPGKYKGKVVKTPFSLPINFALK